VIVARASGSSDIEQIDCLSELNNNENEAH
jgi:hypothetical protein